MYPLPSEPLLILSLIAIGWLGAACARVADDPQVPLQAPPNTQLDSQTSDECFACHGEIAALLEKDLHIEAGLHCAICHGVSKGHLTQEIEGTLPDRVWRRWLAEEDRYEWRVDNASESLAAYCASCHADIASPPKHLGDIKRMQWGAYLNSRHGKAVQEGSLDAPTCTDCHWVHGIGTENWDKERVVNQCASCHANQEMMVRAGVDPNVIADFDNGEHTIMGMVEEDLNALSCLRCHDQHSLELKEFALKYHEPE